MPQRTRRQLASSSVSEVIKVASEGDSSRRLQLGREATPLIDKEVPGSSPGNSTWGLAN